MTSPLNQPLSLKLQRKNRVPLSGPRLTVVAKGVHGLAQRSASAASETKAMIGKSTGKPPPA
jgi:hypothetical protein